MSSPLPPEPPSYRGVPIVDPSGRVAGTVSIVYFSRNSAVITAGPGDALTVADTATDRPVALASVALRRRHDGTWYNRHGGCGLPYLDRPGVPVRSTVAETVMGCLFDTVATHYTSDIGDRANLAHAGSGRPTGRAATPSPRRAATPVAPPGLLERSGDAGEEAAPGVVAADVLPAVASARRTMVLFGYELTEPLPLAGGRLLDRVLVRPAGDLPAKAYGRVRADGGRPPCWVTLPAGIADHVTPLADRPR